MASSTNSVEVWSLPSIFSAEQITLIIEDFVVELYSTLDFDSRYAAAMRGLTSQQSQHVQQLQKKYLRYLLNPVLSELAWLQASLLLRKEHARYGIPTTWMAEAYSLFARHLTAQASALQAGPKEYGEFCSSLIGRLLHDLTLEAAFTADESVSDQCGELSSRLDHLLLTIPSIAELYRQLMDFLMQIDGVAGGWLGRVDEQGIVHSSAACGAVTAEYLGGAPVYLLDNLDSPLARAWLTGETQFLADWSEPQELKPLPFWRERGLRYGWRSSCAIPIAGAAGDRDALLLYSKQLNFFGQPAMHQLILHLHDILGVTFERLRLLEALQQQNMTLALYKNGMDASQNGILISDAMAMDHPIRYVNAAFEHITGYSAQESIGKNCRFLQGEDTAQPELEAVRNSLQKGESCSVEVRNYRKDGAMFWNSMSIAPVRDDTGTITHFIGIQNDITNLKTAISENSHAKSLYRALMSAAELIIRTQSERELLDEMCRLLVESELFSQVWVARPNIAGDLEIESIFSTVELKQYRDLPNVYAEGESRILAVRAWQQSRLQYTNDQISDPDCQPIQNFYREHDLHASAVVPLYRDGDLWALLTLLSHESNIFNTELLELLERIGRLIGHGLDALDLRQILEEERQHQSWLARHDALTDILNRRGVIERMEEAISRARRHKKSLAVAVMDLDSFKSINDLHGHPTGDLLLRTVADRLQTTLRQTDAVGRLGSDEFVLILEDIDHENDLILMLARVQAAVEVPIHLSSGRSITLRSSIGVTLFPQDDSAPERLLRHAERALYAFKESKDEPAERWMLFQAEADEQKYVRRKTILSLFRSGNVRVHYQPIVDLQTGQVAGIEALARLAEGNNPLLPPSEFIPQLSAADLSALTRQVMDQSIQNLHRLDKAGFELKVGINFEPTMLADAKAMHDLRRQVEASGLAPNRFILELLERADTLSVAGAQDALRELKSSGARIALDDVGSAYSSLLRVKELPVDMIKLDRSFLIGLEREPKELRFLMNLVHLARALGLEFVAEGIECTASGDALAALGVRLAQGYAIAKPMGIEELVKWLKRYKPVPWTQPTSILGAVALQLRDLDASGRILEQQPSFLRHLLSREADWQRQIGAGIRQSGPGILKLTSAYRTWQKTVASLSTMPGGIVDFASFQTARSIYEEQMFEAAIDADPREI